MSVGSLAPWKHLINGSSPSSFLGCNISLAFKQQICAIPVNLRRKKGHISLLKSLYIPLGSHSKYPPSSSSERQRSPVVACARSIQCPGCPQQGQGCLCSAGLSHTEAHGTGQGSGLYYKELAHVIMKADKTRDLWSASWRPRRADGVGPMGRQACSRPRKNCSSSKSGKARVPGRRQSGSRSFYFSAGGGRGGEPTFCSIHAVN